MQSADIDFALTMGSAGGEIGELEATGKGSLQDGGKQMSASLSVDTVLRGIPVQLLGDVVLQNGREAYFRIRNISASPLGQPVSVDSPELEGFLNRWWLFPGARQQPSGENEADPSLIPLQLRALDVDRDNGLVERDGILLRELEVHVNRQRLRQLLEEVSSQRGEQVPASNVETYAAEGKLRIHEDLALLYDADWRIRPLLEGQPSLEFFVKFRHHGSGVSVLKPEGALPLFSGVSPITLFLNGVERGVPDSMEPNER